MEIPVMPGLQATTITSPRLTTRVLFRPGEGEAVLFVHGNASSATFWEETMLALPAQYHAVAPDQRGYGSADRSKKVDATRGMADFSDDAFALLDTLGIQKAHIVGHSLGGAVVWRMMMDAPERILSVTVAAPGSPYGFGGSKGPRRRADHRPAPGGALRHRHRHRPALRPALRRADRAGAGTRAPVHPAR